MKEKDAKKKERQAKPQYKKRVEKTIKYFKTRQPKRGGAKNEKNGRGVRKAEKI